MWLQAHICIISQGESYLHMTALDKCLRDGPFLVGRLQAIWSIDEILSMDTTLVQVMPALSDSQDLKRFNTPRQWDFTGFIGVMTPLVPNVIWEKREFKNVAGFPRFPWEQL